MNKLISLITAAALLTSCGEKKEHKDIVEAKRYADLIHKILAGHCKYEKIGFTGPGKQIIEVIGENDKLSFGIEGSPGKPTGWKLESTIDETLSNGSQSVCKIKIEDWNGDGMPEHVHTAHTPSGQSYHFTEEDYRRFFPESALGNTKLAHNRISNLIYQEEGIVHRKMNDK